LATVVLDSDDLQRVGRFWEIALERELEQLEPDKYYWLPSDPPLTFVKVPEPKITKHRVHIDWHAPDREVEVAHLIALGATRLWDVTNENFEWTRMSRRRGQRVLRYCGCPHSDQNKTPRRPQQNWLLVRQWRSMATLAPFDHGAGRVFFEGTMVASENGDLAVQRRVRDLEGGDGFVASSIGRRASSAGRPP
jgi:hypothetical protein